MASAAVDTQLPSTSHDEPKSSSPLQRRTLRWPSKLFKSKAAHDIAQGAQGGKPAVGAAPAPDVEERDPIQHVAGLRITANDPAASSSNHDTGVEDRLTQHNEDEEQDVEQQDQGRLSPRQRGKQRVDGTASDEDDPTHGAGAQSTGTRRSSVAKGLETDEDEDVDAAEAYNGGTADERDEQSRIAFYHRDKPYFWLSNSSDHAVVYDGQRYPTAEHLFQSLKFLPHRADIAVKVRKASNPSDALREARKHATDVKRGWITQRKNVASMRTVLLLKFSQHSALQTQLLQTNDAELVEDSPLDAFWGIGGGGGIGAGRNELGKALVRTRESLRQQIGLGAGSGAKTV